MSKDGTPGWAYDEDGYCVDCGAGNWKHHYFNCELRDALDVVVANGRSTLSLRSDEVVPGVKAEEAEDEPEQATFDRWFKEGERQGWVWMSDV